jgi:hypothetical protein
MRVTPDCRILITENGSLKTILLGDTAMIRNFLNAFRILGTFNLILLIGLALIGGAMWNVSAFSASILKIINTITEHDAYNKIQYSVLHIQQLGRDYLIYDDHSFVTEDYQSTQSIIDEQLAGLAKMNLSVPEGPEQIMEKRDNIAGRYQDLISTPRSSGSITAPEHLSEISGEEASLINQLIVDLIAAVGAQVETSVRDYQAQRATIIGIGIILLGAFPLLALWGFVAASGFTAPLIQMANAVAAIGGLNYQGLQGRHHSGAVGPLADSLDRMAQAITARSERLEQEAATLRDDLYTLQLSKLDVLVAHAEISQQQPDKSRIAKKGSAAGSQKRKEK